MFDDPNDRKPELCIPAYLWSANTAGNNERFTALTRYKLTLLQQAVAAAKYTIVPGQNYNGEHVTRGSNIQFMLRVKVIPYTPHH